MKTVLLLTPSHSTSGGVESILRALCENLPARGWRPVLGLARGTKFNRPELFLAAHGIPDWIEVDGRGGTSEARVRGILRAAEKVRPQLVFSARVYDAHEAARRLKTRDPSVRFGETIQAYESDYLSDLRRWAPIVDVCVTSGELVKGACVDLCGLDAARCTSIPGGVKPGSGFRKMAEGPLTIGYAGRLEQAQKRAGDLVRVAEILRERGLRFRFRLAGSGPEEAAVTGRLAALLGKDFEFCGWIGGEEPLRKFYRSLDIFLHAAGHEGVTIAPREAMAEGAVPVISEFVGFWTERHFLPGENCLSFRVGDASAAAEAILRLDGARELLLRLSRAAAGSQTGAYSWEGALDAWASAFDNCLALPARPAMADPLGKSPDSGRLARLGLPPAAAQFLRDLVGRKPAHLNGGDEWPHAGPPADAEFASALKHYAERSEEAARAK